MKRKAGLLGAALLCVAVLLGGCSFLTLGRLAGILGGGASASDPDGSPEGEPVYFERIVLTTGGTSTEVVELEVTRTEEGVELKSYRGDWPYGGGDREEFLLERITGSKETYGKLARLLGGCGVRSWDGFSGSDPNVLDGESFHLRIELSDGGTVEAGGTNAYPRLYRDFVRGISACFEEE